MIKDSLYHLLMDLRTWKRFKLFLFVFPGVALVFIFHYLPLWGWSYAFFDYRPGRPLTRSVFVAWNNFKVLFGNAVMLRNLVRVLTNTFGIHFLGYLFSPLPMLFAVLLSEMRSPRFNKVVQTVTTLPHFISWVIMFSLATNLFGANGLFNSLLKAAGANTTINVLTSKNHVWITQVLLQQWKNLGWSAIIYFAAIAGIDQELYEAAMVDGAGKMRRIWHITLPLLIPTYFVLLIMSIGNFLNTGVDQYLAFGNALNKERIEVLDLYVYNLGIGSGQISFSVAVGIMKSAVALILFSAANFVSKRVRGTSVF
jgi:putative aldouronate transport system permease protein